tara:strand:+ start:1053 stop:2264 length:1212 start_codon:yes stop_codon:yes gene_type:complete
MNRRDERGGDGPSRTNWLAVAMVISAAIVASFQIGKAPAALPVMRADLGLSLDEGVWIISIFNLMGIIFGMTAGAMGDRLGHRRLLMAGFVAMAAASFLGAVADGFGTLLASRVLEGFGFIVIVAVAPPLFLLFSAERHRRLIFGMYSGYWPAGVAIMVLVTPAILDVIGWRGLWNVNGVLAVVMLVIVALVTRHGGTEAETAPPPFPEALRTFLRIGPMVLALTFATYSSIHGTVVGLLPTFYVEAEAVGLGLAATLTAVVAMVNVGGNILGGLAMHRGAPRWLLVIATFVLVGASALLMYDESLSLGIRLAAAVFLSFIAGVIPACLFAGAAVMAPSPQLVGATTGLMMQGSQLGQLVGPVAMVWVVTTAGTWDVAPVTLIVAALGGCVLILVLRAIEARR